MRIGRRFSLAPKARFGPVSIDWKTGPAAIEPVERWRVRRMLCGQRDDPDLHGKRRPVVRLNRI